MIGIFDSGLGGLTVVKKLLKENLGFDILYFGDTARLPYGTKSKKIILKYSKENSDFLIKKGAKVLIIACNTSSAIAADYLKKKFKVPIFDVITPTVRLAVMATKNKKIGIIATPSTIKSNIYQSKIKKISKNKIKTYVQSCPLLVPLIEEGWLNHKVTKEVSREYLSPIKRKKVDVLILGCTHYPLIKKIISKEIGKKVIIIDSAESVACEVEKFLTKIKLPIRKKNSRLKIFLSDEGYGFSRISRGILKRKVPYEII